MTEVEWSMYRLRRRTCVTYLPLIDVRDVTRVATVWAMSHRARGVRAQRTLRPSGKQMTSREMGFLGLGFSVPSGWGGVRSVVAAQSGQSEGQANLERNKALVRRWIEEGFNRQDLKVIDAVFAENFTVNGSLVGRGGLKQNMT